MHKDDKQIGYVFSRREAIKLLSAGIAYTSIGQDPFGSPFTRHKGDMQCIVRPELTEGPYFLDDQLNRSDIRIEPTDGSIREGALLLLTFNVSQITSDRCRPLPDAIVDIWHCDAQGVYSGVENMGGGGGTPPDMGGTPPDTGGTPPDTGGTPPRGGGGENTVGMKFLRGYQATNRHGDARFITIYPGWYTGRTIHVHFKIRTTGTDGNPYEFTSQFFFEERLNEKILALPEYQKTATRDVTNEVDGIFQQSNGMLLLKPKYEHWNNRHGHHNNGHNGDDKDFFDELGHIDHKQFEGRGFYKGVFNIALDLSDTAIGAPDGMGSPGGGGPGGPPPGGII